MQEGRGLGFCDASQKREGMCMRELIIIIIIRGTITMCVCQCVLRRVQSCVNLSWRDLGRGMRVQRGGGDAPRQVPSSD